ncbi:MAG: phosphopantothenoylcysteine synthase [Verrucomicrobiae bacterium]|nr:phosphopantothenoylcysteine synthase [Verrucomicrobiae bacterium]
MRIIVTCGPGCEPIDEVRFLSNSSTGELGSLLASELQQHGFEVLCLQSRLATYPMVKNVEVIPFSTNDELAEIFQQLSTKEDVAAIFHAAALCDYRVEKIAGMDGSVLNLEKIPTSIGRLNLTLEPSLKVIAQLRACFPHALLVGWKYEVSGTREEADQKAQQQIEKYQLDASIANGPATTGHFDVMLPDESQHALSSKKDLVRFLARWLQDTLPQTAS